MAIRLSSTVLKVWITGNGAGGLTTTSIDTSMFFFYFHEEEIVRFADRGGGISSEMLLGSAS